MKKYMSFFVAWFLFIYALGLLILSIKFLLNDITSQSNFNILLDFARQITTASAFAGWWLIIRRK